MAPVRLLDDILISKISAGEVVERPASVLKEFLENSLDAGADKISITLDSGGKRLVKVADNGCGMSRDDALLCIERHATSKISDEKDLARVKTFGFRGEALPSIAAVSRFSLTTRPADKEVGTAIAVEGGKIKGVKETGCPVGTTVEARSIFYNTRPRLSFLKTNQTELSRCAAVIRSFAAANHQVDFEVLHNGRNLFRFTPADFEDRVREVLGGTSLYPIEASGREGGARVVGFLCSPSDGFSSMMRLYCYVNGRYLRDRFLNKVVMESLGRTFDAKRYPQGVIFISVPSENIDVNVHPTKHEVRFKSPREVAGVLMDAIKSFLSTAPWMTGREKNVRQSVETFLREKTDGAGGFEKRFDFSGSARPSSGGNFKESSGSSYSADSPETINRLPMGDISGEGFFSQLKVLGQAGDLYIICEGREGLVVIDQHAAHERVNFERFRNSYRNDGGLTAQKLLIPEIIEMRPEDAALFTRFENKMKNLGLKAEMFGENAVRLESVPSLVSCMSAKDLFIDTLARLDESGCPEIPGELDKKTEDVLATMACHKSIRAGYTMAETETKSLLSDMDKCESPHFCPHGRPVAVNITYGGLEKMFNRK